MDHNILRHIRVGRTGTASSARNEETANTQMDFNLTGESKFEDSSNGSLIHKKPHLSQKQKNNLRGEMLKFLEGTRAEEDELVSIWYLQIYYE